MTTVNAEELRSQATRILHEESAPLHLRFGDDLMVCKLPANTRVIHPNRPIAPVANRGASIRHALANPTGAPPLADLVAPGNRVTISLEGIGAISPMMRAPDARSSVLDVLLQLLEDRGVEDYEIIVDRSLDRRLSADELRHVVGPRAARLAPRRLYQLDVEDRDAATQIGLTSKDEPVLVHRRVADSDLLIHVRVSPVPTHGASAPIGACYTGATAVALYHARMAGDDHALTARVGAVLKQRLDVFHIEITLNNDALDPQLSFMARAEETWRGADLLKLRAARVAATRLPAPARRALLHAPRASYDIIGVHAGDPEATHAAGRALALEQHTVHVEGQADIVIHDVGYITPFNVNAAISPLLVRAMILGHAHALHTGTPLLKRGGVLIIAHPCLDDADPDQHPSAVELFNRCLPLSRDPQELERRWMPELTHNPNYVEMYRRGSAYHSSQPFALWRWAERGQQHAGKIIVVGAQNSHVPDRLGWTRARTMDDAIAIARSHHGPSPRISFVRHSPGVVIDVR